MVKLNRFSYPLRNACFFPSVDLGLNDDGQEVKRQKLTDGDSALSMGDLTKSEIQKVMTINHFLRFFVGFLCAITPVSFGPLPPPAGLTLGLLPTPSPTIPLPHSSPPPPPPLPSPHSPYTYVHLYTLLMFVFRLAQSIRLEISFIWSTLKM